MQRKTQQQIIYSRVAVFVLGMLGLLVFTLLRVGDLQIYQGDKYQALAQANRQFTSILPRQRGIILDRFGEPLIINTPVYNYVKDPRILYSDQYPIEHDAAMQLLATQSAHLSYTLQRQYMAGSSLAHVLGYTAPVSDEDLTEDGSLLMTDLIGKLGLERVYEQQLRGLPGRAVFSVNAFGEKQRLLEQEAPHPGEFVETTLDPYLSTVAYQALQGNKGAVVILDAGTGAVLSLVSSPSFDPNLLSQRAIDPQIHQQRQRQITEMLADERKLFFNRAVSGLYPPGSVFKIVTALAALDSESVKPEDTVLDEGVLKVGEYSYANWFYTQQGGTDGEIGVQRALARSNDIYFYKAAEWVGPNLLAEYARRFSFGERGRIEIPGQAAGLVPDVEWKEQTLGERWFLGNTYHYGIGQGDVLVTPLQVAQMTQAVANRGSLCPARILNREESVCEGLGLSDESLRVTVAGLLDACSSGGTGYMFFPWNEQYRDRSLDPYQQISAGGLACKTGTSEFGGQDSRGFRRTHGWFTLFVNLEQLLNSDALIAEEGEVINEEGQQYQDHAAWLEKVQTNGLPNHLVITVLVESDEEVPYREGSRDAAPVAMEILEWMLGDRSEELPENLSEEVLDVESE